MNRNIAYSIIAVFFLLLGGTSLRAQDYGKMISRDSYHTYWDFTFNGQTTSNLMNYQFTIYEKALVKIFIKDDGSLSKDPAQVFKYVGKNADGELVFHWDDTIYKRPSETIFMRDSGFLRTDSRDHSKYGYTRGFIPYPNGGGSYSNSYGNGGESNNSQQVTYVVCPACNGTGRDQGRIQYDTNGGSRYCSTCGTTGLAHQHIYGRCGRCDGTGRVRQY